MPTYLHPGVYVEEIPSGAKPIEGVGTSTAIFIGFTNKGTVGEPILIGQWDDYVRLYNGYRDTGASDKGAPMAYSVAAFFQNGGTKAYIARLAIDSTAKPLAKAAGWQAMPGDSTKALLFTALNEGEWADGLVIRIEEKTTAGMYVVDVGRLNSKGVLVVQERYNDVSFATASARYITSVINGFSELVEVEVKAPADVASVAKPASYSVGTSVSGPLGSADLDFSGAAAEVDRTMKIALDGGTAVSVVLPTQTYTGDLAGLAALIQSKVRDGAAAGSPQAKFTATVNAQDVKLVLQSNTYSAVSAVVATGNAAARCGLGAANGGTEKAGGAGMSVSCALGNADADFSGVSACADRTLSIAIDGGTAVAVALQKKNYSSDLAALAAYIQTKVQDGAAAGSPEAIFTATVNTQDAKLVLQSNTATATSAVVVTGTAAAGCKLGTANAGAESVASPGTSVSGALGSADLDFTSIGRTLSIVLDKGTAVTVVLPKQDFTGDLSGLASSIQSKVRESAAAGSPQAKFTATANTKHGTLVLQSNTGSGTSEVLVSGDAAAKCKLGAANGGDQKTGAQNVTARQASGPVELAGGGDGTLPNSAAYDDIFTKLVKFRDINIVCLPGQEWKGAGKAMIERAIAHAEEMRDRMVLVDPPSDVTLSNENSVNELSLSTSTYAVTYYPWIKAVNVDYDAETNPGAPDTVLVPPSGYAAGMWAKIDGRRGVWKAPAGVETGLGGIASLNAGVDDNDQDALNPLGVNCIRTLPGFGPVIWGARTLSTKANPEWRYVPVRRTAIYIERSIYNGVQWAVFEGNDHLLWSSLRTNIAAFMDGLFRAGAFQGEKAADAYFVRCGLGDTMTQDDIDRGQVVVIVGFAPLKPAEFVIIRVQQKINKQ
ncbi:MAG: phage tail sheath subtilisin-like domain-containing protein [Candidatus Solibacter sp.]|nr:phage tail sheath subtilisin-like domain-containing protein [Candidatus Solibacter sp.]